MEQENNADLGTAQNNPTNKEVQSQNFDTSKIAEIFSKDFLGEQEDTGTPQTLESEETAEVESTAEEENIVLSQEEETISEESDPTDADESQPEEESERGLPKGVKKRIDKLTAKRREAEAEVERLKSELERLEQEAATPAQIPTNDSPFAHLRSIEEVNKEYDQAKQVRRWCELNPDGAVVTKPDGSEVEYTAEDVRMIKIKTIDAIEEHLPKRVQFLQQQQQFDNIAQKDYTWWKDRTSKERQMAESFIKAFPEILRAPDHKLVLGHLITGIKTYESQKRGSAPQRAPIQPKTSASPVPLKKNQVTAQVAKQRYASSNSRDDLSAIILSKFL
jgi:hypothetical protein